MTTKEIVTGFTIGKDLCAALNLDGEKVESIRFDPIEADAIVTATVVMAVYQEELEEVMKIFKRYRFVEIPENEQPSESSSG
ncbi:hypothetical protein VPH49_24320 [Pseudomonas luteola]|uniref:hypothetical protein n=1 Tax=Pseudomonas luteola TaxID=47886 RepID=UPI003A8AEBC2